VSDRATELDAAPPRAAVRLPGGTFSMGSDDHYPEEAPAHRVRVGGFGIDPVAVTNRRFAEFVAATGYVTVAERPPDPAQFPGAPPENLVPGSMVFTPTRGPVNLRHLSQWWRWVPGASWRHPEGVRAGIDARLDHPVVHIAHEDAAAYAAWVGATLPTEAQWEYAARGGLEEAAFTWGDEPRPGGRIMANTWDGPDFPWRSTGESGWLRTAPVGSFPPNGYGLFDMAGNVWEWTDDWWTSRHLANAATGCCVPQDPRPGKLSPAATRPSRSSPSRGRWSREARTSAPTPTVCATAPPPAGHNRSTPA
jgi:formylglycine-generating enzyme